ncbi:MAG: DNA repair protein RecO [Dehalococcoidia bacterium]|nr:DNA repair protein RecO [Dehalococcoidia bacterium]
MPPPRIYKTAAIVLRQINLGEADKIITLYTPNLGKVRAVAKGIRRARSRLSGHLETLNHCMLVLARGRNLDVIDQGQTVHGFSSLKENLWLTGCAIYAADLVDSFTGENIENPPLFDLLLNTLSRFEEGQSPELNRHYFELHLLRCLGYRPQLRSCPGCRALLKPVTNYFSAGAGGVLCPNCHLSVSSARPVSSGALRALLLLERSEYGAVGNLKLLPEVSREVEGVIRGYLSYLLEGEARSVRFLDRLRRDGLSGSA